MGFNSGLKGLIADNFLSPDIKSTGITKINR
jgi:hypothetical protein